LITKTITMISSKHIATFLLGAAAGAAYMNYNSMTEEEKEKLMNDLKAKANGMKTEAEQAMNTAADYFDELRSKGSEALKENLSQAEDIFNEIFGNKGNEQKPA
jgi:hypothetical protein